MAFHSSVWFWFGSSPFPIRFDQYHSSVETQPDPIFADPRLARIYDDVDGERDDLDHYVGIVEEFDAQRVIDVGCGTGELACRLARLGINVIGVDPAQASLDVARTKPGADLVTWIHGDTSSLPGAAPADLALMTGNVAQVFTTDAAWRETLLGVAAVLTTDGRLVFETRDPSQRAWESWDTGGATTVVSTEHGDVATSTTLLDVSGPLVTFRHEYCFAGTDDVITSESTLRFRTLDEIEHSLATCGFAMDEVRDAPDRPNREFVVLARCI